MKADELKPFYNSTFRIEALEQYFHQDPATLRMQLFRLCRKKKLIRLKKNCYTFPDAHPTGLIMAQEMVQPSYHSLESVLSLQGIIPEGVAGYTLVTSKKTQQYSNIFGNYSYRHLPPELFFGVEQREDGAYVATPEKALLDYLYLNSKSLKAEFACFQAERFDRLEEIDFNWIKENAGRYGSKKLLKIIEKLDEYRKSDSYQAHR